MTVHLLTDNEIEALSTDPLVGFVQLTNLLWVELGEGIQDDNSHESAELFIQYIYAFVRARNMETPFSFSPNDNFVERARKIHARAVELELEQKFSNLKRPMPDDATEIILSSNSKNEIHDLLNKIRQIVDHTEFDDDKKNRIFVKIADLSSEVDRSKTKSEMVFSLFAHVSEAISEGAQKLDPALDRIERIMKIMGKDHMKEAKKLPAPEKPKQLPSPDPMEEVEDDDAEVQNEPE